jgi:glycosyltransferase involved in cell wall biosynthesis
VRTSIMESLVTDDEVLMFADGDYQAFADYLVKLHQDPEFGRQLSKRARRFTQDHAWESEFDGYVQLLSRLTGRELSADVAADQSA